MLNEELLAVPDGFTIHPKLVTQLEQRREVFEGGRGPGIVWAHAEALAFASLLTEGIPIRLTGQDTERGTFSQRHLVLHDPKTGQEHCPIQHLPGALAPMELHNSPLSEMACLGFEYGYSQEGPETLVLWEAQFGDFANGAQVIIDQFIVSGLAKWGQTSRLTLLLPARLRGLGPRALLGAARALPAARRRGQHPRRQPDHAGPVLPPAAPPGADRQAAPAGDHDPEEPAAAPQAASTLDELSEGRFQPGARRSGRATPGRSRGWSCAPARSTTSSPATEARQDNPSVAIGRVELLYPFPQAEILALAESYPNLEEVVWVQEEPRNMGARAYMSPRLLQILPEQLQFGYIGRPERAASGEGYPVAHAERAEPDHHDRAQRRRADLAVPAQAPRRALAARRRALAALP